MGIALFFLLAFIVAAAIVYPLLPGRGETAWATGVSDDEIEAAVQGMRRARSRRGRSCPACGAAYQPGDRFCIRCGGSLTQAAAVSEDGVCPACGAPLHADDQFCARCGHTVRTGEGA